MLGSNQHIALTDQYSAHNYSPLEVVIATGSGSWVTDIEGRRYLDLLSAYSAVNFGHSNPRILKAAHTQLGRITLTSRAFYNDQFGPLCKALCELCQMEMVLVMNTGAEAVETAIKAARRWGYNIKKVSQDAAEIIVFDGNFAGRTTTIISFSSDPDARAGFGPFTPGFKSVPFGDASALAQAITPSTVAIMVEPIQGEGGVIIPPAGFLTAVRELCTKSNVLMIADEVQTGLCRTGALFACDHEGVKPDLMTLGKSLGGGIVPISAVVGKSEVLGQFTPGSHGSTFGGNSFACAIASEVIKLINEDQPHQRAQELGAWFLELLKEAKFEKISAIRGRGLMIGLDIKAEFGAAKKFASQLKDLGILCKDTRKQTLRLAPPLTIERKDLEWAVEQLKLVL